MSARFRLSSATHRAIAAEGRANLTARFPDVFAGKDSPKRPLKIGIDKDLVAAGLPGWVVGRALGDYTSGPTYRRNLVAGAERIGLDGLPAGVVTEREAADAAERLVLQMARAA